MPGVIETAIVRCPTCRQRGTWFAQEWGPFCSRRCKLIDLGKWLGEEHVVSEPLRPEHFEPYADLPADTLLDLPESDTWRSHRD
jgi:hypothetical protein